MKKLILLPLLIGIVQAQFVYTPGTDLPADRWPKLNAQACPNGDPHQCSDDVDFNDVRTFLRGQDARMATIEAALCALGYGGAPCQTTVCNSFTPASGAVGSTVTVTGSAFNAVSSATLNDVSASFSKTSDTQLTFTVPNTTSGTIKLFSPTAVNGTACPGTFTVGAASSLPQIAFSSTASGGTGQEVTLSWSVSGAITTTLTAVNRPDLEQNVSVSGSGSRIVSPMVDTTYRLTATNSQGTSTADVTVYIPCNFWVAKTGSDSNSGLTENAPKLTINGAMSAMTVGSLTASAGKTLCIKQGTYTESLNWGGTSGPRGTSWSSPVTLTAYRDDVVTVTQANNDYRIMKFSGNSTASEVEFNADPINCYHSRCGPNDPQYVVVNKLILDGNRTQTLNSGALQVVWSTNDHTALDAGDSRHAHAAHHLKFINMKFLHNFANMYLSPGSNYIDFINPEVGWAGYVSNDPDGTLSTRAWYIGGDFIRILGGSTHDVDGACGEIWNSHSYGYPSDYVIDGHHFGPCMTNPDVGGETSTNKAYWGFMINGKNVQFTNNEIDGGTVPIQESGIQVQTAHNVTISGNYIHGTNSIAHVGGIYLYDATTEDNCQTAPWGEACFVDQQDVQGFGYSVPAYDATADHAATLAGYVRTVSSYITITGNYFENTSGGDTFNSQILVGAHTDHITIGTNYMGAWGQATAPTIASFTGNGSTSPTSTTGGAVTLAWTATGSPTSYTLSNLTMPGDPQEGAVTGTSKLVSPFVTTTYRITATNANGSNSADITVTVPCNYYVATAADGGSDSNSGLDSTHPKLTIHAGINLFGTGTTGAGKVLCIRGGTYTESLHNVWTGTSGPRGTSWSSPVTVTEYPGETVVIHPSVLADEPIIQFTGVDGLVPLDTNDTSSCYLGRCAPTAPQYIVINGLVLEGTTNTTGESRGLGLYWTTYNTQIVHTGMPWQAGRAYALNENVYNGTSVYRLSAGAIANSTTAPTCSTSGCTQTLDGGTWYRFGTASTYCTAKGGCNDTERSQAQTGSHHIRFQNLDIRRNRYTGVYMTAGNDYIEFVNILNHWNGWTGPTVLGSSGWYLSGKRMLISGGETTQVAGDCMMYWVDGQDHPTTMVTDGVIRKHKFHDCGINTDVDPSLGDPTNKYFHGLTLVGFNLLFDQNEVYNTERSGVYVSTSKNITFTNNSIHDTGLLQPGYGAIELSSDGDNQPNVKVDSEYAALMGYPLTRQPTNNVTITGNTFHPANQGGDSAYEYQVDANGHTTGLTYSGNTITP